METCRHFKGDRPCKYYWIDKSWDCSICVHHNPFKERISSAPNEIKRIFDLKDLSSNKDIFLYPRHRSPQKRS